MTVNKFHKKYSPDPQQAITSSDLVEYFNTYEGRLTIDPYDAVLTTTTPYTLTLHDNERTTHILLSEAAIKLRRMKHTVHSTPEAAAHLLNTRPITNHDAHTQGIYTLTHIEPDTHNETATQWTIQASHGNMYQQWHPYYNTPRTLYSEILTATRQRTKTHPHYTTHTFPNIIAFTHNTTPLLHPTALHNTKLITETTDKHDIDETTQHYMIAVEKPLLMGTPNAIQRLHETTTFTHTILTYEELQHERRLI